MKNHSRTVRQIKVTRSITGGHATQMAKAVGSVGAASVAGAGVAVAAGVVTMPFFLPIIGAVVAVGLIKGVQNGSETDEAMAKEMDLPESEWQRIPRLTRSIEDSIQKGHREFILEFKEESDRLSGLQEFMAGGKGYVNVSYRVRISYC